MFSSRPTRRQSSRTSAVAAGILQTEICEQRLVLTPSVITPTGNFQTLTDTAGQNFTPEIQWTAEPAAVSYDLWVSSLESYDTVFVQRGMTDTFYPTDGLPLGKLRIWVRTAGEQGAELLVFPEYGAMELASLAEEENTRDIARSVCASSSSRTRIWPSSA